MITVDFVNKAITGIIDRFTQHDYVSRTYHEVVQENDEVGSEEIHFFIEDEIETLLQGLNILLLYRYTMLSYLRQDAYYLHNNAAIVSLKNDQNPLP